VSRSGFGKTYLAKGLAKHLESRNLVPYIYYVKDCLTVDELESILSKKVMPRNEKTLIILDDMDHFLKTHKYDKLKQIIKESYENFHKLKILVISTIQDSEEKQIGKKIERESRQLD
jgi:chromosomal replication initiation ATPase DnaA